MTLTVDQTSSEVSAMAEYWKITETLMGGTPAMRKAGQALLPKWPNEEDDSYAARLATATLFPAYRRTVSVMSGKPFAKELVLAKETPEQIVEWAQDIDKEGVNLHAFSAEMFVEVMAHGFAGILVDSPKSTADQNGLPQTIQQQKTEGIRPYFVRVKHNQILGWMVLKINGTVKLIQLRISECATVPDGEFGEKVVERVRVLEPGKFRVYEKQVSADGYTWNEVETGATGINFIPFVPLYGTRTGYMASMPPLLDLAYLNIEHWQSKSDQQTILHVARVPILFAKMLGNNKIVVGSNTAVQADSEGADLRFVEHSGAAIGAGKVALESLEEQMIQIGAEILVAKPGIRTATEASNDAEGNKSDLQRIVETFEDSIDLALDYMAKLASIAGGGGNISLFKDFAAAMLSDASSQTVLSMQQTGLISKPTTIREQQRRGVLSADIDPEEELALASEEGPPQGIDAGPASSSA